MTPLPGNDTERALPGAVLLDFFGTLAVHGSLDDWIDTAASRSRTPDDAERATLRSRLARVWPDARERYPDVVWDLDPVAHHDVFVGAVGRDDLVDVADALYATMADQCEPNTGAVGFVRTLADAGVPLAVVSNTAVDVRPVLARWGVADHFGAVVLSYELGVVKPEPEIFRAAADALGVAPERCLMIGDTAADDGGAVGVGMRSLIATPHDMRHAFERVLRSAGLRSAP